jgi:hypothetical protein
LVQLAQEEQRTELALAVLVPREHRLEGRELDGQRGAGSLLVVKCRTGKACCLDCRALGRRRGQGGEEGP